MAKTKDEPAWKKQYLRRKNIPGICSNCHSPTRPLMPGMKKCEPCYTMNKKAQNALYDKRRAAGLCPRCGKGKLLAGLNFCQACSDKGKKDRSKPAYNERRQVLYKNFRREVLSHYGNQCVCCGESLLNLLCLDHVNGDGAADRSIGRFAERLLRHIKKSGYPDTFQILCYNCNCARGHQGFCHVVPKGREKPYSEKCECCGEPSWQFLNFTKDLKVLCYNCNFGRAHHGFCHA